MKLFFTLLFVISVTLSFTSAQIITIAEAREDLNGDFIPDRLGDTVTVQGVVFTPRFHTEHNTYYIDDGTAGINVFMYAPPTFNWNLGDELQLTGKVDQYYGSTEIEALDSSSWVLISTGNPIPNPVVLTIAQYLNDPETYEGSLIGFISLTMVGGTWPLPNNYATVQISDGIDTLDMYINRHTDIDDNPEPTWPKDIIGVGSQFTSIIPPNDGYQLLPRFYNDFLPPGTLPVELTSFTVISQTGKIFLNWATATETNNLGFEVEREIIHNNNKDEWVRIAFVEGHGTTTEPQTYSYVDEISSIAASSLIYRLKQIDFLGSYEYSDEVFVENPAAVNYTLQQNYPNPFNPVTNIKYGLPVKSQVFLVVYNLLGEKIIQLVNEEKEAGQYSIEFEATGLPSGIYLYQLKACNFVETKKMILLK